MTNLRVSVPLDVAEKRALVAICEQECRPPAEQMRYWLREEARKRGLLSGDEATDAHPTGEQTLVLAGK